MASSGAIRVSNFFRPVKPHRIGHQELGLKLGRRRDAWDQVHQLAVVGKAVLQVWVRPVGAPQHAIGVPLDHQADDRDEAVEGRSMKREIRARDMGLGSGPIKGIHRAATM